MKTSRAPDFAKLRNKHYSRLIAQTVKNLKHRGFSAQAFSDRKQLRRYLLKAIPHGATVGIPGSVTVREIGLIEPLEKRGNHVVQHWKKGLTETTDRDARIAESAADYYLTGANAITIKGDIINIDGVGNRVAAMIFGPKHVFIIAGRNKLVSSIEDGIERSKNCAAVMNARRVGASTPCISAGTCVDCDVEKRICRVITIIQYRPFQTDMSVMIVNEDLGF
jgi:L-lactate utilization protein LutB